VSQSLFRKCFVFVLLLDFLSFLKAFFRHSCDSSGFLIGMIVCSIMMSVVRGAVNTLIVCWADSPSRLEENHPEATKEMADAISGSTSGPFVICWSSRRLTHSASSPDSSLATSA